MDDNFLRRPKVLERSGVAKSTLNAQIKAAIFRKPVKKEDRTVGSRKRESARRKGAQIIKHIPV